MRMALIFVFGVGATVHAILVAGVFITVATSETARKNPDILFHLDVPTEVSTNSRTTLQRDANDHCMAF